MLKGKRRYVFLFLAIFTFGFFLRVGGINWGGGWYFHPDENNMAQAVSGISFPHLDPHFYDYGQFPLFLAYFSQLSVSGDKAVSFSQAIFWLRFWSAMFSSLTLLVGYSLARLLFKENWAALTYLLLLSFASGLIQMAHFGTTESILTFVFLGLTYLSCQIIMDKEPVWKRIFLLSFLLGVGLASKVSAFLFFLPIGFVFLFKIFGENKKTRWFFAGIILVIFSMLIFFSFSPFYFLNYTKTRQTISYQSMIASGSLVVFYTRQFINTRPIIFQLTKILPWTLGLPMFVSFIMATLVSVGWLVGNLIKDGRFPINFDRRWLVVYLFWMPWFLFNSFLFIKWTRYATPALPFLILFVVWAFFKLQKRWIKSKWRIFIYPYIILLIIPGFIFIKVYYQPDIRLQATVWLNENLPNQSVILSESGNVADLLLFNKKRLAVKNMDFYHLDENETDWKKLNKSLVEADYFLSGSRRVFANHLRLKGEFPKTAQFYQKLFSGKSGFALVKKFRVFNDWEEALLGSDLTSEETWTVFDHPTIRIYRKTQSR